MNWSKWAIASEPLRRDAERLVPRIAAAIREETITYPDAFIQACREAHQALLAAVARVTVERGETSKAVQTVEETRRMWDLSYTALREVTSGFLRLKGDLDRMSVLFRDLPKTGSSSPDTDIPPASESEPEAA